MNNESHIKWIDLARAIAILGIVLCHATEGIYSLNLDYMFGISTRSAAFAFSSFTVGRLGVLQFLMITGYLLLDREYDTEISPIFEAKVAASPVMHLDLVCNI